MDNTLNGFNPSGLWIALIVIVGVCAAFIVVGNAINMIRGWRKPMTDDKLSTDEKLANDKREIDKLKKRVDNQETASNIILRALMTLCDHEITGNSIEHLRETKQEITEYLTSR